MSEAENMNFNADVSRLLDIVANALYSNIDVFLRELISNAADACDKLRYESIQNPNLIKEDPNFKIHITKDVKAKTITITDNGIGMDKDELCDNLGTIAKSGTKNLMDKLSNTKDEKDKLSLIGQFGVGFYSTFMVADKVSVTSQKAGNDDIWTWESDGKTGYTIRKATKEEQKLLSKSNRGTAITAHIKADDMDFLLDEKIEQVITTWSDHINIPIYLGEPEEGEEAKPINTVTALWMRPKSEISKEQYEEFYNSTCHGIAFDHPLSTIHWKAEGTIEYTALLFIPSMRPHDMFDPSRRHSVRLYVKRIFITDDCEGLMYPWLRFIRGLIDSEDLPLNISREMLQKSAIIDKIRNGVANKILNEIDKLSKNDEAAFATFWGQFGMILKEGLYDAHAHRDAIFKVTRFYSTNEENKLTSLDDYISRMKEGQDEIYYITAPDIEAAKNSPQLEGFKAKGLEVLYFTDAIDEFWLQIVDKYKDKNFKSVTKGSVDLDKFETIQTDEKEKDDGFEKIKDNIEKLAAKMTEILKDEVANVVISKRLTESPVCLVADEGGVDMQMERVMKIQQHYQPQIKRHMEINPKHALIKKMATMIEKENNISQLEDATKLLYDQALIIQGDHISDPTSFARRMAQFMDKGLAA